MISHQIGRRITAWRSALSLASQDALSGLSKSMTRGAYPETESGADFEVMLQNPQRIEAVRF